MGSISFVGADHFLDVVLVVVALGIWFSSLLRQRHFDLQNDFSQRLGDANKIRIFFVADDQRKYFSVW
jgi:hypothetical protein